VSVNFVIQHVISMHHIDKCGLSDSTFFFLMWCSDPTRVMASSFLRFLDHTQRRNTVGRSPLDEWSARRRDLYLTTHNTHNRQTSMPPVGFEPTISVGKRPQNYALDRAVTGTSVWLYYIFPYYLINGPIFGEKGYCAKICVLIFSTDFFLNVSHYNKNSVRYYHK